MKTRRYLVDLGGGVAADEPCPRCGHMGEHDCGGPEGVSLHDEEMAGLTHYCLVPAAALMAEAGCGHAQV